MTDQRCPMCGKPSPEDQDTCQFCGARLKPLTASTPVDSQPIHPGERPTKRDTAEFEKVRQADPGSIPAGEAPTRKNTAELEQALPAWLRTIREGEHANQSSEEESPGASLPLERKPAAAAIPDWLSGLNQAAEKNEEVPDWLSGLRPEASDQEAAQPVDAEREMPNDPASTEWMSRLGQEVRGETPDKKPTAPLPSAEPSSPGAGLPDWMQALAPAAQPEPAPGGELPDWLGASASDGMQELEWPSNAPEQIPDPASASRPAMSVPDETPADPAAGSIQAWLSDLPSVPPTSEDAPALPAEGVPSWIDQLRDKAIDPRQGQDPREADPAADWRTPAEPAKEPTRPIAEAGMPDWIAKLKPQTGGEQPGNAAVFDGGQDQPGSQAGETPDWLSNLKADVNAHQEEEAGLEQFEVAEAAPERKETGPLPDWLAGIQRPAEPAEGTPALISDAGSEPAEGRGAAFAMEAPDWLSKLKPEQEEEAAGKEPSEAARHDLESAELPSWVQAMRPVASVMDETKSLPQGQQEVEQSGPLAGLRGVLPASPGLGALRKPPAYTAKLQVSDGQQRYANFLERLVANEGDARNVSTRKSESGRIWRWAISGLLILVLAAALLLGGAVEPTSLQPSDQGAASTILAGLPQGASILAAFDYDPALSGELEAVAAPIFDQLLSNGARLTLVSTSPTGPLLVERFLKYTPLVNVHQVQSGIDANNLGYLAGGPAGIQSFADNPRLYFTSLKTPEGTNVWDTPPLAGIHSLADFTAVIILTDNADTARSWIEQAGPYLGDKPMLLIVSAQAEPMIRPYFDAGQIAGMVTGLADAKVYEQAYGRPGLAQVYWNPLSYGILTVEVFLLFGGMWSLLASLRERTNRPRKGS